MSENTPGTRDVLTQEEAEARAKRVSHVDYDLRIDLTRSADTYRGDVTLHFQLVGNDDLFVDFRGTIIRNLVVNGEELEADWTGYRLTLPGATLDSYNSVRVVYENEYDHGGDGFHQFHDTEDGEEYLYTNFEPYEAHRLFPCFDQPDIKAEYDLTVAAPSEWELICNAVELSTEPLDDGRTLHTFHKTERFSTYLFALIVGPYHAFRNQHGNVPLGFFCRKSLVKHVDIEELWEITKQGLDFYSTFFDYSYPFTKYDQVFVPEFNAGAMENVGAVTHSERLVFRDPPTQNQRLTRAETLLHEMAHMWFGNLVTMRWWNDLWLNESFATFMAYLALTEATRFTTAWQSFNAGMKAWAYRQDQLITTHPIAGQVPDTDQTLLNFDGITYGKGAAVIKQLVATIGYDGFRDGMRRYFRKHAFANTTLAEFLNVLQEGTELDLHEWAQLWLETPSLNTVRADWKIDGDHLTSMTLEQTAPDEHPTLRPHHMELALIREDNGELIIDSVPLDIDGAETEISDAIGHPSPVLVVPNHNDHAFIKVALDESTLSHLESSLERVDDALLRQLIWDSLWNMVRDQQLKSSDYLELAAEKVITESDHKLIESILATIQATIARYVPDQNREAAAHRVFEVSWQALNSAPLGDLQIIWARMLIGVAINPEDIEYCGRLADGDLSVDGLTIDQDMRWDIASRYVAYDLNGASSRVELESATDPSDRGQRAALRAEVAVPNSEVKEIAWKRFEEEGYGSLHLTSAAMSGFHWWVQRDLLETYTERFFDRLPVIFEQRDNEFARSYFATLFPGYRVEPQLLERSQSLLVELGDRLPLLTRSLREANDDLSRAIRCREYESS